MIGMYPPRAVADMMHRVLPRCRRELQIPAQLSPCFRRNLPDHDTPLQDAESKAALRKCAAMSLSCITWSLAAFISHVFGVIDDHWAESNSSWSDGARPMHGRYSMRFGPRQPIQQGPHLPASRLGNHLVAAAVPEVFVFWECCEGTRWKHRKQRV